MFPEIDFTARGESRNSNDSSAHTDQIRGPTGHASERRTHFAADTEDDNVPGERAERLNDRGSRLAQAVFELAFRVNVGACTHRLTCYQINEPNAVHLRWEAGREWQAGQAATRAVELATETNSVQSSRTLVRLSRLTRIVRSRKLPATTVRRSELWRFAG